MKQCPQCGTEYPDESAFCPQDGAPLLAPEDLDGDDLAGTVLNDKWLVEERRGEGGMGVVYRGHQLSLHRKVAIKMIRPGLVQPDVVVRFKREARAVAAINHPNIVTIHDFDETESGQLYIVMEFCDGLELSDRLRRDGRLPVRLALEIASQAASALAEAHARDIVHRDLKPDNIFLVEAADGELRVKVVDFGIAKVLSPWPDDSTADPSNTGVIGTPAYMSPEQLNRSGVDPRSDLYSLGCVLYESLVGESPFEDLPLVQMMVAHGQLPPPSFEDKGTTTIAPQVEQLVMRLLSKKKSDRFASAADLKKAIDELLDSGPLEQKPRGKAGKATDTFNWSDLPAGVASDGLSESSVDPFEETKTDIPRLVKPAPVDAAAEEEEEDAVEVEAATPSNQQPPAVNRPTDGLPGLRKSTPKADRTWTIDIPAEPKTLAWGAVAAGVLIVVGLVAVQYVTSTEATSEPVNIGTPLPETEKPKELATAPPEVPEIKDDEEVATADAGAGTDAAEGTGIAEGQIDDEVPETEEVAGPPPKEQADEDTPPKATPKDSKSSATTTPAPSEKKSAVEAIETKPDEPAKKPEKKKPSEIDALLKDMQAD